VGYLGELEAIGPVIVVGLIVGLVIFWSEIKILIDNIMARDREQDIRNVENFKKSDKAAIFFKIGTIAAIAIGIFTFKETISKMPFPMGGENAFWILMGMSGFSVIYVIGSLFMFADVLDETVRAAIWVNSEQYYYISLKMWAYAAALLMSTLGGLWLLLAIIIIIAVVAMDLSIILRVIRSFRGPH
jgi:hypothetical protein